MKGCEGTVKGITLSAALTYTKKKTHKTKTHKLTKSHFFSSSLRYFLSVNKNLKVINLHNESFEMWKSCRLQVNIGYF